jgi:hypothetical protein
MAVRDEYCVRRVSEFVAAVVPPWLINAPVC